MRRIALSFIFILLDIIQINASEPVNLLAKTYGGQIIQSSLLSNNELIRLFDGDKITSFSIGPRDILPVSIVFGFADKEVTPSQMRVFLPDTQTNSLPTKIEVLGSLTSPNIGFFSIGVYNLNPGQREHILALSSHAVRYIMLRILDSIDHYSFSINEVEIWGILGRERRFYNFNFSPISAETLLKNLSQDSNPNLVITPDEKLLFQDAQDAKLDRFSFLEATLIASGVTQAGQRRLYIDKVESIYKDLNSQFSSFKNLSPYQKAKFVFLYLHKFFFKRFRPEVTDINISIETGNFNCASSSICYNIIGRRLGLDLRAIEVPDHTFSILYDGLQHWDIETTTPIGFDPKEPGEINAELQRQTGVVYISEKKHTERRELNTLGQVAIIYYNRGVKLGKSQLFPQSTANYIKALLLDKEFKSAIKNTIANFGNHGFILCEQKRFREAIETIESGLKLAPQDNDLKSNLLGAYHNWGVYLVKQGQYESAVEIFREAHQKFPGEDDFVSSIAYVYFYRAQKLEEEGDLPEALQILEQGIKSASSPEIKDYLKKARPRLFFASALPKVRARDWRGAIEIYEMGLKMDPDHLELKSSRNAAYIELAEEANEKYGIDAALNIYREVFHKDPEEWRFVHNIKVLYINASGKKITEKKYKEALDILGDLLKLYPEETKARNNILYIYQAWTESLLASGEVLKAQKLYKSIKQRFPDLNNLEDSYAASFINQGVSYAKQGEFEKASEINCLILDEFPDSSKAQNNLAYVYHHWANNLYSQKDFSKVKEIFKKVLNRFPQNPSLKQRLLQVVVNQSILLIKSQIYDPAVDILTDLHKNSPEDENVNEALKYAFTKWAEVFINEKKWEKAVSVYEKALKFYQEDELFKNNIEYCKREIEKASDSK